MFALILLFVLFLFFYALFGGPLQETYFVRVFLVRFAFPIACAVGCFVLAAPLLGPLAGIPWGVLGWFLPGWAVGFAEARRLARHRALARDFVTSASGMFAAGQTAGEVVRTAGANFAEPFGKEFREMVSQYELNPHFSFPRAFRMLAHKYRLPEFEAVAAILEAASTAGGPRAAGKGLSRLGLALRQKERLLAERAKVLAEVKIAGYLIIGLLLVGLLVDATVLRGYFAGPGRIVLAVASAVAVGLIFAMRKLAQNKDLEGAG